MCIYSISRVCIWVYISNVCVWVYIFQMCVYFAAGEENLNYLENLGNSSLQKVKYLPIWGRKDIITKKYSTRRKFVAWSWQTAAALMLHFLRKCEFFLNGLGNNSERRMRLGRRGQLMCSSIPIQRIYTKHTHGSDTSAAVLRMNTLSHSHRVT